MALIPESEQPGVHGLIGRHLLKRMKLEDQIDAYVFEICNQFNKAQEGLSPQEREEVIELNLRAGRKALKATAFDGASGYFQVAWGLLGDNPWGKQRLLALDVYLANVERLFAAARFEEAIILVEEAVRHTHSPTESIPFLLRKLDCEMSMGNPGSAFSTGIRFGLLHCVTNDSAAHLLGPGLALPIGDGKAERFADSMHSRVLLSEEEIFALANLPPLENVTISFLQEILSKLGISVFESDSHQFYHVTCLGLVTYALCATSPSISLSVMESPRTRPVDLHPGKTNSRSDIIYWRQSHGFSGHRGKYAARICLWTSRNPDYRISFRPR